jgi:hypothetical protein
MTYATLKSDIAVWARRGDLTGAIPSFVALAESEIYKTHSNPLRVREMETNATVTVTGNSAPLPADFLEARYIRKDEITVSLSYTPPEEWRSTSNFFTVIATSLKLPSGVSGTPTLVYLAKPAPLANDSDTNVILENYYGIYLSASMKYAAAFVKDLASVQLYQGQLDAYLDGANLHNKPITVGSLVVRAR